MPHYAELLSRGPRAPIVEVISENFIGRGGRAAALLERVRADAAVYLHGVSLSLGSTDPLDEAYLAGLIELKQRVQSALVSDHACFSSTRGHYVHDLWPLPYTEEAVDHVCERVRRVQDRLGEQIALENVSSYVEFRHNTLTEWEFLGEVARRADCWLLLDLNNVVVSANNHGYSAARFVDELPLGRVRQLHLAGHSTSEDLAIDDHAAPVPDSVWELYRAVLRRCGSLPAIVEWDADLPPLGTLEAESHKARVIAQEVLREIAAS